VSLGKQLASCGAHGQPTSYGATFPCDVVDLVVEQSSEQGVVVVYPQFANALRGGGCAVCGPCQIFHRLIARSGLPDRPDGSGELMAPACPGLLAVNPFTSFNPPSCVLTTAAAFMQCRSCGFGGQGDIIFLRIDIKIFT
jgi:hypothetical protein